MQSCGLHELSLTPLPYNEVLYIHYSFLHWIRDVLKEVFCGFVKQVFNFGVCIFLHFLCYRWEWSKWFYKKNPHLTWDKITCSRNVLHRYAPIKCLWFALLYLQRTWCNVHEYLPFILMLNRLFLLAQTKKDAENKDQ